MATLVSRPNSAPFWNAYLNYTHIPANQNSKVWDTIGGSIGESYGPVAENSCAARVSYGLDYGNSPIVQFPAASVNLPDHVYMGKKGDGMRYIVSAMQMRHVTAPRRAWAFGSVESRLHRSVRGNGAPRRRMDSSVNAFVRRFPPAPLSKFPGYNGIDRCTVKFSKRSWIDSLSL